MPNKFHPLRGFDTLSDPNGLLDGIISKYNLQITTQYELLLPDTLDLNYHLLYSDIKIVDYRLWFYENDVLKKYVDSWFVKYANTDTIRLPLCPIYDTTTERSKRYVSFAKIVKQTMPDATVLSPVIANFAEQDRSFYFDVFERISPYCDGYVVDARDVLSDRDIASLSSIIHSVIIKNPKPLWVIWSVRAVEQIELFDTTVSYRLGSNLLRKLFTIINAMTNGNSTWLLSGFGQDTVNDCSGLVDVNGMIKSAIVNTLVSLINLETVE